MKAALPNRAAAGAWLVWIVIAVALFAGVMALQGSNNFEAAPRAGSATQRDK
jgi:hypothetical protein